MCVCALSFLFLSNVRQGKRKRKGRHTERHDGTEIQSMKMRQHFSAPLSMRISFSWQIHRRCSMSLIHSIYFVPRISLLDARSVLALSDVNRQFPRFPRFSIHSFFFPLLASYSSAKNPFLPAISTAALFSHLDRYSDGMTLGEEVNPEDHQNRK